VDWPATRVLVEYGPGIGTFTAEILRRLRPGGRFLAYQFSGKLRTDLERVFGEVERDLEPFNVLPARIFSAVNNHNAA
jgi:phospholipid N-methyltransferase